jgi:hypothetical protein
MKKILLYGAMLFTLPAISQTLFQEDFESVSGNWTPAPTTYMNTPEWTATSVSLSAWDNQATLKFRFRWQNGNGGNQNITRSFAVDQISVTGQATDLGIDEAAAAFMLYPNPTTGTVNITWKGANGSETIRLLDYSGRLLEELTLENHAFSLGAYPAGSYLVQLVSNG